MRTAPYKKTFVVFAVFAVKKTSLKPVLGCVHLNTVSESMADSTTMTIRLDEELKARLDLLARTMHRSKSYLAAEALRDYVALNEWQLGELEVAVKEADDGDYASADDIRAVLSKWGMNGD